MKKTNWIFLSIFLLSVLSGCKLITINSKSINLSKIKQADIDFNLSNANKTSPDGIMTEVAFFVGGAGEFDFCSDKSYENPTIVIDIEDSELMEESVLVTCGWDNDEEVLGTVIYPDGRKYTTHEQVYLGSAILSFKPWIDDPSGSYVFKLEGKTKNIQSSEYFNKPKGPRLYQLGKEQLLIYGFSPNESIRLLCYQEIETGRGELKGWIEYSTGTDCNLLVNISQNIGVLDVYAVVGQKSGLAKEEIDGVLGGSYSLIRSDIIIEE